MKKFAVLFFVFVILFLSSSYAQQEKGTLNRLFPNETIKINETDSTVTIAKSPEVFQGWIDPDFKC